MPLKIRRYKLGNKDCCLEWAKKVCVIDSQVLGYIFNGVKYSCSEHKIQRFLSQLNCQTCRYCGHCSGSSITIMVVVEQRVTDKKEQEVQFVFSLGR